jgi:serine/threonine protein kinase
MKAVSLQGLSAKDVEDTLNEARLMHRLQHDNIIQHIDSWCESQWLFIIMEYAEQGDLGAVVAAGGARVPRIPEEDVLRYISDIAKGLKYLHDNCVLHRCGIAGITPRATPSSCE